MSVSEQQLLLVTGHDCHLCAHALEVLADLGLAVREVDVTSAEARQLAARGVPLAFLPVLWDGERVLGYGRLSARAIQRRRAA